MKKQCPRCAARSKDRHQDNLHIYKDGSGYCFSCHYYLPPKYDLTSLKSKIYNTEESVNIPNSKIMFDTLSLSLPTHVRAWLATKHVEPEFRRGSMMWNEKDKELVFPIWDQDGSLVFANSRYFGDNKEHPKYISRGDYKNHPLVIGNIKENSSIFIVEDFISALRIASTKHKTKTHGFVAYPMFGSTLREEHLTRLAGMFLGAIIFLDPDKRKESFEMKMKIKHMFEHVDTVYTSFDPKDMKPEDLQRTLTFNYDHVERQLFNNDGLPKGHPYSSEYYD